MNRAPIWQPSRQLARSRIPVAFRDWLLDRASLTRRLRQVCEDSFEVRVLQEKWVRPRPDESRVLGLRPQARAMVREVQLLCRRRPCVFARTVIPVRTLTGKRRRLSSLGNRPLGAFLFSAPGMRRGTVELSCMRPDHDLFARATSGMRTVPDVIWGRRSVFLLNSKPLLVSEIFLEPPGACPQHRPYSAG